MEELYLGVDVGGTKTHALLADGRGGVRGFGEAGPGNHETVGYDGLRAALKASVQQALAGAGASLADVRGAGFGVAGYDWPSERQPTLEAVASLGVSCPVEAVNDAALGLFAGARSGWGVALEAGTGCNCAGRDRRGRYGHFTGCGHMFGEWGGAPDVVWRAIVAVSRAWSRRGPETRLSEAFLGLTGAASVDDLLEGLTLNRYQLDGSAARLVTQVAAEGDEPAREAVAWVARELGGMAAGMARQLEIEHEPFELVLIGSLFQIGPLLTEPLLAEVQAAAPYAQPHRLAAPPVIGGVLLGMEQAGLDPGSVRDALIANAAELQADRNGRG